MNRRTYAALSGIALLALTSASAHAPVKMALPFIENDYPKAVALAKSRHVPIFVEAWAPW